MQLTLGSVKKSLVNILVAAMLPFFSVLRLDAQTLVYDAFIEDKKVGRLTVVKEEVDNAYHIHSLTKIQAKIPFPVTVKLEVKSSYIDNILIESEAKTMHNQKIYSTVTIHQTIEGYALNKNGNSSIIITNKLVGADCFYFAEPTDSIPVIALASGDIYQIKTTSNLGEYIFARNKKDEHRQYHRGVLQEMNINHTLYTVELKLVR